MPSQPRRSKQQTSARDLLATNLVLLRRRRGWSQDELAYQAGLHRTFVAHVERRVRNIALDNVEKLARALDVQVYELLLPRNPAELNSSL